MSLLDYFDYDKPNDFHIYTLKKADVGKFLSAITVPFRHCYIIDGELNISAAKNGISRSEFLERYVLPDVGNIKSGDFGEMISRFFVMAHYSAKGLTLISPKKWLWKEDRNKATPYTDVVAFYFPDTNKPSVDDFIVSVESKMKATPQDANRLQDAIDGARIDMLGKKRSKLSRLAKTLIWLDVKYSRIGDMENKKIIQRYLDPVTNGNYQKIFKAIAIIDKSLSEPEISDPVTNDDDIKKLLIIIDDLKGVYETNYHNIKGSV
ncbi:hypothetical protein AGMMS49546_04520 [Spirochaetia bacterium]|nr:hypothetical protein AGMMS49546_04520 [Spirochaetia bacterium]